MRSTGGAVEQGQVDNSLRAQLSSLGSGICSRCQAKGQGAAGRSSYGGPGETKCGCSSRRCSALARDNVQDDFDFGSMVRQARLQNLQNRLGFLFQLADVDTPDGQQAVRELERARLLQQDTLCWDAMPAVTREWMRANRSHLAAH